LVCSLGADNVTVKFIALAPLFPSGCEALLIESVGRASSFTIVPVPVAVATLAFTAEARLTVNVSSDSASVSADASSVRLASTSRVSSSMRRS
jgi:hypothetical protein